MSQENVNPPSVVKKENMGSGQIETVETPNGIFSVIYNVHGGGMPNKSALPDGVKNPDAFVLELMGISPKLGDARYAAGAIAQAQGGTIVWAGSKYLSQPVTRREFIKRTAILTLSGYFSLPAIKEATAPIASRSPSMRKIDRAIDTVHPETKSAIVEGRNSLLAQKSEAVAKLIGKELGHKPEIAISIGAAHYGLGNELQKNTRERIRELKNYKDINLEKESLIVRIDFEKAEDLGKDRYRVKATLLHDPDMQK